MKLPWLVLLALALAGCSDDGGSDADEPEDAMDGMDMGDADDSPAAPADDPADMEAIEPPTRWDNQTAVVGLVDCTLVGALVGAGAPADAISQAVSVSLSEEDWGREYEVQFIQDALSGAGAPSSAPATICVGFDNYAFSDGTSGTIPEGASDMIIGGDVLLQGDLSVRIGPEP